MRSLATEEFGTPEGYELLDLPEPKVLSPNEIIIKVHAASINPADVMVANGAGKGLVPTP